MAIASRKLLGAAGLGEMILLMSPILITIILFFGDGTGIGNLPAAGLWFAGLIFTCIIVTQGIYTFFGSKIKNDRILWDYNSEKIDCGIIKLPSFMGGGLNIPYRLVFYGYTCAYIIVHAIFGVDNISNSISIISIIFLLSIGDIARLLKNNCYIGTKEATRAQKIKSYVLSGLVIGILLGGGIGVIGNVIDEEDKSMSFFKTNTPWINTIT